MEHGSEQTDGLLRQPSSHLSDYSLNSNSTLVTSPSSPPFHRHGHRRATSVADEDASDHRADVPQQDGHGLGISSLNEQKRVSITGKPVESKSSSINPGSADLLSPMSAYRPGEDRRDDEQDENLHSDSNLSSHQAFTASSDHEPLYNAFPRSEGDFECRLKKRPESRRGSWLAVSILILSIYSTVFSGLWLSIAIIRPRYGHTVSKTGGLPFTTASTLFAAFAKTIELSFVTVFVAFIGQALSKRALFQPKGVTIAEMSMRSWVMQPGTMISHWGSVRYAGATGLGVFALLVALMAMIYTTASDALVTPVLKFGQTENRLMYGKVSTSFANKYYIEDKCNTPIQQATDPEAYGETCIQIEHAGQAFHNYMQYLTTWVDNISSGNTSANMKNRPDPVGMLYDNTTLKGSWTHLQDMSLLSERYGRIVNNVTMVMPHAGVVAAAMDPLNGILQPSDLNGLGTYSVQASVPSPVVNVLCADVSSEDMAPMVFTEWPSAHLNGSSPNVTSWTTDYNLTTPSSLVHTAVDDLFEFDDIQTHPIFSNFPKLNNTVLNVSSVYGHESIYLLATSATGTYTMCSMRVAQSPDCFTEYNASMSGGSLTSHCGDLPLAYSKSEPKAPNGFWEKDWVNVASEWGFGLSLNAGITDGNGAISRLLTQLIPTTSALDPDLPSISEALAVLAGCTLILSSQGAPFIHYWNYTAPENILTGPQYQAFNATLKTQEYQSGGDQTWQSMFYIVLVVVFVANVFCLVYFVISGSHITDFMEPQNMFPLSVNSPPSAVVDGSCGGSLEKEQFRAIWRIMHDSEREHLYIESRNGVPKHAHKRSHSRQTDFEMKSPIESMYSELGRQRTSRL